MFDKPKDVCYDGLNTEGRALMPDIQLEKLSRETIIDLLAERDGNTCMYPGCGRELDFSAIGPFEITIDHWIPKCEGLARGWTWEEINDLDNLRLMEKRCNAKKGQLIPNEDGTLPTRPKKEFRYRRDRRAQRPDICTECNAGRNLEENQWCNACGSGPQPQRYPKWRQMKPADCDHDLFFCWACHLDPGMRRSAIDAILTGGEGYE